MVMMATYKPTAGMKDCRTARALEWRREYGRGGTAVGVARARDIVNGKSLSERHCQTHVSHFSAGTKPTKPKALRGETKTTCGPIHRTWSNCVGFVGRRRGAFTWSKRTIVERLKKEEERGFSDLSDKAQALVQNKVDEHNEEHGDDPTKRATVGMLAKVYERGIGAYKTNPASVRPNVSSPEQWAAARINSFLYALRNGKFRSGKHDTDLLPSGHPMSSKDERSEDIMSELKENIEVVELPEEETAERHIMAV